MTGRSVASVEWVAVVVALLLRVPFLGAPPGPDEAGFLQVAAQWSPDGDSLYGSYWVDRPPLLLTLYQGAAALGGVVPLRVVGCAAVAVTVLASARTARLLAGAVAARWTAVVTAALLVAPQVDGQQVNGELLAAPFVASGLLAVVAARQAPGRATATRWAATAGVASVCAVLVKQNMVDVLVFAVVAVGATWWSARRRPPDLGALTAGFAAGASAALGLASLWTVAHGTSLTGALDAMYAFRVQALHTVVDRGGGPSAEGRAWSLAAQWALSGLALMTVALAASVRRWAARPVMVALGATVVFDLASVTLGGGFWRHYLVQPVVPLAIASGVLAARACRAARGAASAAVGLSTAAALAAAVHVPATSTASVVGAAVAGSHRPGDTLTTLYGESGVNLAAGLPSPYQHLWNLPIRTRDPGLTDLDAVLAGPDAPIWLVVVDDLPSWGLDADRTARLVATRYHLVGGCRGARIYLRDDVARPAPDCGGGAAPAG